MDTRQAASDRASPTPSASAQVASHTVVQLRDVELTLPSRAGPVNILRGVSQDIPSNRSVAIVGPSGSGKTSLLMVIAGL